jgi:hypothetical protein
MFQNAILSIIFGLDRDEVKVLNTWKFKLQWQHIFNFSER